MDQEKEKEIAHLRELNKQISTQFEQLLSSFIEAGQNRPSS